MSVTLTAGVTAPAQSAESRNVFANSQLSADDFLRLMIHELVNQDPLNPMKNEALLAQVSQIKNMETLTRLDKTMSGMTTQQQVATAGGLIGREITGLSAMGENVTGDVVRVKVGSKIGVVLVTANGHEVNVANVFEIRESRA